MTASLFRSTFLISCLLSLFISLPVDAAKSQEYYIVTTDDFQFVYRARYRHMVPGVIVNAETALLTLKQIFSYTPSEKITVIIQDNTDIGGGGATALPHNRVRLEIAPYSFDYEFTHFGRQVQWLLSHELVHIVMGDQASAPTRGLRKLFGKVAPVTEEPMTIPFSLLTIPTRFTPTWHQEGIAVFMETWLNGGYGRILGSFDEMFFRTLVHEGAPFLQKAKIDFGHDDSFFMGSISYFYGARFAAWLTIHYDLQRLLDWMTVHPKQTRLHIHFKTKFKTLFGVSLEKAWTDFLAAETDFQRKNLERIAKYRVTEVRKIHPALGWVTRSYIDASGKYMIFGMHGPHKLAAVKKIEIETGKAITLHTLPTPKLLGVASTAFDRELGLFYFTTHNTRGYRDLWVLNIDTGKAKLVYRDMRLGELAINPVDHSLMAVMVNNGRSILTISPYPYHQEPIPLAVLEPGTILAHLAVSPNGKTLAATLHRDNSDQEIILIHMNALLKEKRFLYETVTAVGNPEYPAWSPDGTQLYWDAYISGVANIFRKRTGTAGAKVEALSNVNTGLFHPAFLDAGHLVVFYYTTRGFQPCVIPRQEAEGVAAIHYLGQQVVEKYPELKELRLNPDSDRLEILQKKTKEKPYHGLSHMRLSGITPIVNAFENKTVIGLFGEMTDLTAYHRLTGSLGISFNPGEFHMNAAYMYKDILTLNLRRSPSSFYDLVNRRHINSGGLRASMSYKKWWVYDMPSTLEQWFYLEWGRGIVDADRTEGDPAEGDLFRLGTRIKGKHLRRAIGSIDDEQGSQWNLDAAFIQSGKDRALNACYAMGDISILRIFPVPHNVLRLQVAAGIAGGEPLSASRFYFGGFGSMALQWRSSAQYRDVSSLPGLGDRRSRADRFIKVTMENSFPPINLSLAWGDHYAGKMDLSVFAQYLALEDNGTAGNYFSTGAQLNIHLISFYTIQSTLSVGYAHAWETAGEDFNEVFISLKLFR